MAHEAKNYNYKPGRLDATAYDTLCSDAIERIARMIGATVDYDDPEQALVAAVERKIATLVEQVAQKAV